MISLKTLHTAAALVFSRVGMIRRSTIGPVLALPKQRTWQSRSIRSQTRDSAATRGGARRREADEREDINEIIAIAKHWTELRKRIRIL